MQEPQTFNWLQYVPPTRAIDIKVEPSTSDSPVLSLLSPPSSPPFPRSVPSPTAPFTSPSASSRRRSFTSSLTGPKRIKPYPIPVRESRNRADSGDMSVPPYGNWSSAGVRGGNPKVHYTAERRSSDSDEASSFTLSNTFSPTSFVGRSANRDHRPLSSDSGMATSSLTGAMGNTHLSSRSRSQSPPSDQAFHMDVNAGLNWIPGQPSQPTSHTSYAGVPGQNHNVAYHHMSSSTTPAASSTGPYASYSGYNPTQYASPESISAGSTAFASSSYNNQSTFSIPRPSSVRPNMPTSQPGTQGGMPFGQSPSNSSQMHSRTNLSTQERVDDEIRHLRKKVRELELVNESSRIRVQELEAEVANEHPYHHQSSSSSSSSAAISAMPSPLSTPSPPSASFNASWKARTDARIRQFCSLNRAGNALCAWHDSRRERRAYPPRMAPPGHLNCGCTYEEALFEESLARHSVGSYHPGETVRMDPALRNPLLKLLQQRYNYKDGDFERDPVTGNWVEGEGHAYWEARAVQGASTRKSKGDERR